MCPAAKAGLSRISTSTMLSDRLSRRAKSPADRVGSLSGTTTSSWGGGWGRPHWYIYRHFAFGPPAQKGQVSGRQGRIAVRAYHILVRRRIGNTQPVKDFLFRRAGQFPGPRILDGAAAVDDQQRRGRRYPERIEVRLLYLGRLCNSQGRDERLEHTGRLPQDGQNPQAPLLCRCGQCPVEPGARPAVLAVGGQGQHDCPRGLSA